MKVHLKAQLATVTLLLGLALGSSLDVHAQHNPGAFGRDAVVVNAAGPSHHRHGPPVHRGHGHRQARPPQMNAQARLADWYARTAVSQSHTAWRFGCANSHPRWSTSYQDHYDWAYRQSANQAQREIERRDLTISHCLAW